MYVAAARARDILKWADAPRSSADLMAMYQRALDPKRAPELTKFLEADPMNIVPGAVIIAVRPGALVVAEGEALGDDDASVACVVSIPDEEVSHQATLQGAIDDVVKRLNPAEVAAMNKLSSAKEVTDQQDDLGELGGDDEEEEEAGTGLPDSYLAVLASELQRAAADWEQLEDGHRASITEYLKFLSKPGMIIDGQHRVYAAKGVDAFDVVLPIVLLDGLPMSEQVFHFYVLNNKAKPLTKTELRRTISTALTADEIDGLWSRFKDAGVDPEKVRLTHRITSDAKSPFRGLVDFGFEKGFIKENVAYQLVDGFVSMPRKYRALWQDVPSWGTGDKGDRLDTFYALWNAIVGLYPTAWGDAVKHGKGQIVMKVAMLALQEYVLDNLLTTNNLLRKQKMPPPFSPDAPLAEYVAAILEDLPEEFFTREWTEKQIDTAPGRKLLRATMQEVVDAGGKGLGYKTLFKAKA